MKTYKNFIKEQYGIVSRVNDYLKVKDNFLYYKDINLMSLLKKYGCPLEVAYTESIKERVKGLKKVFQSARKKYKYPSDFLYAYATKANYFSEVEITAASVTDVLETTSSYDLDIIETLFKRNLIPNTSFVVCNGFKQQRYVDKITDVKKLGLNVIPILENVSEFVSILDTNIEFDVGIRLNLSEMLLEYMESNPKEELFIEIETRFGLEFGEVLKLAREMRNKHPHLKLKLIHFHFGHTLTSTKEVNFFLWFLEKVLEYYCILKRANSDLDTLDIGGGLPAQYSLDFDFNYQEFADKVISTALEVCKRNNTLPPNILGEYGRYTVNDHGFFCFDVVLKKPTEERDVFWYLINGSLMTFLPDAWALGQEFLILPLNGWDKEVCKVRLGGITCDPDDTYYKQSQGNLLHLPYMSDKEDLHIGIFGTGAYQEMIAGVGGVHHCLLPEGNELIIYRDSKSGKLKYDKITPLQSPQKILRTLDYHHDWLDRYL